MSQSATIEQQNSFEYEMAADAVAYHTEAGTLDSPMGKFAVARLAAFVPSTRNADMGEVTIGRAAGSAAGNQYGTFKVHAASEAQVRFLASLIKDREHGDVVIPSTLDGISKKSATALIDSLLRQPKTAAAAASTPLASAKQVAFIISLLADRVLPDCFTVVEEAQVAALTSSAARDMITALLARPKVAVKPVTKDTPVAERQDGMYLKDGVVFKVQYNLSKTGLYAKRLVQDGHGEAHFDYAGSLAKNGLKAEHRMTLAQAKEYGSLYGTCCNCGRTLTDEDSIAAGIGPICAKKF
jgi:hypothetical protein